MRWQRNSSSCMGPPPSSKVLCQRWPDELRQRQGEALPQGDHALIARIGWAQIRHLAVVEKKIFVVQGPGFEPPMSFEVERAGASLAAAVVEDAQDRKSTRLNSSHVAISYAVFCLKKK